MIKTKKVMMAAAVLCLGSLLCIGSRIASVIGKTGAYNMLASADTRTAEYPSGGETGKNFRTLKSWRMRLRMKKAGRYWKNWSLIIRSDLMSMTGLVCLSGYITVILMIILYLRCYI